MHRIGIAALSAAVLLPIAPVFGQDAPAASAPPVVRIAPPPPVIVAPPPPAAAAPPPIARPAPPPVARAAPPVAERRAPVRTTRAAPRTRAAAPVRQSAPAPAPVPVTAPTAPAPTIAPEATLPALPPVVAEPVTVPVETAAGTGNGPTMGLLLAALALVIAAVALFAWRRRRAATDEVEEVYDEEPVEAAAAPGFVRPAPEPIAETPLAARPATASASDLASVPAMAAASVEEADADQADVDALVSDSEPVAGRPWIEFMMRPVRAGTSADDTIVQFELTVGNTGSVSAKDVRISTWMFAAGTGTDMERSLIEPPANATVSEIDIGAGDGARVDGEFALPKAGMGDEPVLPVVVADARYRLPDGSEGRTSASFEIGLPEGDHLAPFPVDRASGLLENVEARLHGEPERV